MSHLIGHIECDDSLQDAFREFCEIGYALGNTTVCVMLGVITGKYQHEVIGHRRDKWKWVDVTKICQVGNIRAATGDNQEVLREAWLFGRNVTIEIGHSHLRFTGIVGNAYDDITVTMRRRDGQWVVVVMAESPRWLDKAREVLRNFKGSKMVFSQ